MSTNALVTMFLAEGLIAAFALYFFWKVVTTPPKPEPDSYVENDDEPR
jgi:hypothetical protein